MSMTFSDSAAAQVEDLLTALELPSDQFFVGGSGGLALRGIRRIGDDLDIGVTTALWHDTQARTLFGRPSWRVHIPDPTDPVRRCDPPFLYREVLGTQVHIFYAWRRRGPDETKYNDYNLVFKDGIERVRGWPCLHLAILLKQKLDAVNHPVVRPKDVTDIKLIEGFMDGGA